MEPLLPQSDNRRLGTAEWADPDLLAFHYGYKSGTIWVGRSPSHAPLGYADDRHVCLVSGNRGGKGTTSIVNNLCLWPGSVVVIDPKGENATVTAVARGAGDQNCAGLGQTVHVLDPFEAASVPVSYRSRFNPFDALDPEAEESIDEAGRLADALVVVNPQSNDPFWDESARTMVKGLLLHVLTAKDFEGRRNLNTVRQLITRGHWEVAERLRQRGEQVPSSQALLWLSLAKNPAFRGVVAGAGDTFANMLINSPKQFEGVLQSANRHTEFLDSPAMQRSLEASDFRLSDLKTNPKGVSLYLSLPQRYMNTHYRWLRMMLTLVVTQMEIVRRQPATGYPVLMVLDEFAGLERMKIIETAVAQIAGYGVKLFFVLQSLEQLKAVYKDNWETFLSNCGLKVFFSLEDHFSREYVSKLIGETEIIRQTRSASGTITTSESVSEGTSESFGFSHSDSLSRSLGAFGVSRGDSVSATDGTSSSFSRSSSVTHGTSVGRTGGTSQSIFRRPLISPDEIGQVFRRVDSKQHPAYPGLALVLVAGSQPMIVRRVNYFEDYQFLECFSAHPDHPLPRICETHVWGNSLQTAVAPFGGSIESNSYVDVGSVVRRGQELLAAYAPGGACWKVCTPVSGRIEAVNRITDGFVPSPLFTIKHYAHEPVDAVPDAAVHHSIAASDVDRPNALRDALTRVGLGVLFVSAMTWLTIATQDWVALGFLVLTGVGLVVALVNLARVLNLPLRFPSPMPRGYRRYRGPVTKPPRERSRLWR